MDTRTAAEGLVIAAVGIVAGVAMATAAAMLLDQESRRAEAAARAAAQHEAPTTAASITLRTTPARTAASLYAAREQTRALQAEQRRRTLFLLRNHLRRLRDEQLEVERRERWRRHIEERERRAGTRPQ